MFVYILDLKLNFKFHFVARTARSQVIFEPYPLLFHPKNRDKIEFNPKSKDFKKLGDVLAKFPQMSELVKRIESKKKKEEKIFKKNKITRLHVMILVKSKR